MILSDTNDKATIPIFGVVIFYLFWWKKIIILYLQSQLCAVFLSFDLEIASIFNMILYGALP